jgi:hypothetical protein
MHFFSTIAFFEKLVTLLIKLISTTIESWGSSQAKVYAQTIDAALLKLA